MNFAPFLFLKYIEQRRSMANPVTIIRTIVTNPPSNRRPVTILKKPVTGEKIINNV